MKNFDMENVTRNTKQILEIINQNLSPDWRAFISPFGRLFYYNKSTNKTHWYPPESNWPRYSNLPYGWETAVDNLGRTYYINHISRTTTYADPREDDLDYDEGEDDEDTSTPPRPREVEIVRDPDIGFGFIAGSDKPVIVRFVLEDGPSFGKLLAGDQILSVNGEYVATAPRDYTINMIKDCQTSVNLTVCQPNNDNSSRKSALLSASKKARLKHKPSRVRFSERVMVNGHPMTGAINQPYESCVHAMANILKVFLENGQTKSFKYDNKTTVKDVLDILREKLDLKCLDYFCLVLQHIDDVKCTRLTLLHEDDLLSKIALRPGSQYYRCLFRVIFAPKNPQEMYDKDKSALNYFYLQCFNDILHRRFRNAIKNEVVFRLASLSIYLRCHQAGISKLLSSKISTKKLEQELQIKKFVPETIYSSCRSKEILKKITVLLKKNVTELKLLDEDQIKLEYLKIWASDIILYGAQCYSALLRDKNLDVGLIVSPKFGIEYYRDFIDNPESLVKLTDFTEIENISVARGNDILQDIDIKCRQGLTVPIKINVDEAEDLILLIQGYYKLFNHKQLPLDVTYLNEQESAPPYLGKHIVRTMGWNYPNNLYENRYDMEHIIDLSANPPIINEYTSEESSEPYFKTFASRATQTFPQPINGGNHNVIIEYSEIFSDQVPTPPCGTSNVGGVLPSDSFTQYFMNDSRPEMKSKEVMTEDQEQINFDTELRTKDLIQYGIYPHATVSGQINAITTSQPCDNMTNKKIPTTMQNGVIAKTYGLNFTNSTYPPPRTTITISSLVLTTVTTLTNNAFVTRPFIDEITTDSSIYTSPEPSPLHLKKATSSTCVDVDTSNVLPRNLFLHLPTDYSPFGIGMKKEPSFGLLSPEDKITPIMSFYERPGLFEQFKQAQQLISSSVPQYPIYPSFTNGDVANYYTSSASPMFRETLPQNVIPTQNYISCATKTATSLNNGFLTNHNHHYYHNNINGHKELSPVTMPFLSEKKSFYNQTAFSPQNFSIDTLKSSVEQVPFHHQVTETQQHPIIYMRHSIIGDTNSPIVNRPFKKGSFQGNLKLSDSKGMPCTWHPPVRTAKLSTNMDTLLPKDPSNDTLTEMLYRNSTVPRENSMVLTILDDIDIIDLTMIPVPKTPDQDNKVDLFFADYGGMRGDKPPPGYGAINRDPSILTLTNANNVADPHGSTIGFILPNQKAAKFFNSLNRPDIFRSFSDTMLTYFDSSNEDDTNALFGDDSTPTLLLSPSTNSFFSGSNSASFATSQSLYLALQDQLSRFKFKTRKRAMSLNNVYFIKNMDEPLYVNEMASETTI